MPNDKTYFYWMKGLRERVNKMDPQAEDYIFDFLGVSKLELSAEAKLELLAAHVRAYLFAEPESLAEASAAYQLGQVMAEIVDADIATASAKALVNFTPWRRTWRARVGYAWQMLTTGRVRCPMRKT